MMATTVEAAVLTARVHAADGVRFMTTTTTEAVEADLADYIIGRCDDVLWPEAAREVRSLIADQRIHEAIGSYFANVGRRWDDEWLEVTPASGLVCPRKS